MRTVSIPAAAHRATVPGAVSGECRRTPSSEIPVWTCGAAGAAAGTAKVSATSAAVKRRKGTRAWRNLAQRARFGGTRARPSGSPGYFAAAYRSATLSQLTVFHQALR